jgi:hypothetical protein
MLDYESELFNLEFGDKEPKAKILLPLFAEYEVIRTTLVYEFELHPTGRMWAGVPINLNKVINYVPTKNPADEQNPYKLESRTDFFKETDWTPLYNAHGFTLETFFLTLDNAYSDQIADFPIRLRDLFGITPADPDKITGVHNLWSAVVYYTNGILFEFMGKFGLEDTEIVNRLVGMNPALFGVSGGLPIVEEND